MYEELMNNKTQLTNEQILFLVKEELGDFLYETNTRIVYSSKTYQDRIIKIQKTLWNNHSDQNKKEFELISYIKRERHDLLEWFADINNSYFSFNAIMQERTNQLCMYSELPSKLPTFCAGASLNSFGYRKGYPVLQHFDFVPLDRLRFYNGEFILKDELNTYKDMYFRPNRDDNYYPNPNLLRKAIESFENK